MQQTIRIPWTASTDDRTTVASWQRPQAAVVRSAYTQAEGRSAKELISLLKERFPNHPLGSWAIDCAALDGIRLRQQNPDGKMIFGGKNNLERRQKGLITRDEWRDLRHRRAIEIIGDRTRWGNRHFRLSEDGRRCEVIFLKRKVSLYLPEMSGKSGKLVKAVAQLADACEISVKFSLGRTHLSVTFNPMDLRKLSNGQTLEQVKIAEQGASRKGRKRKDPETHYAAHRIKLVPPADRPVHPEWRPTIKAHSHRAVGIDLNPQWIGITVVEAPNPSCLTKVKILDHRLLRIAIPQDAGAGNVQAAMASAARLAISIARAWNCSTIVHEDGLGKLRWSKKNQNAAVQTINYWSRNAFLGGLNRRAKLCGLPVMPIWGGYSTTIGNLSFDLPDACAAAAEIARRGLARTSGEKNLLPAVPPTVLLRLWKDGDVPDAIAQAIYHADGWRQVHRAIKSAKTLGYRRLHPTSQALDSGSFILEGQSYAVDHFGNGKGVCYSARPVHTRMVRNNSDQVRIAASRFHT